MPALKYSEQFFWLINKQDNSLTIGLQYQGDTWMELIGSGEDHPLSWITTHFIAIPLAIPREIIDFESPYEANIPKG